MERPSEGCVRWQGQSSRRRHEEQFGSQDRCQQPYVDLRHANSRQLDQTRQTARCKRSFQTLAMRHWLCLRLRPGQMRVSPRASRSSSATAGRAPLRVSSSSAGTLAQGSSCGLSVKFEPVRVCTYIIGLDRATDNSLNVASPYATQTISLVGTAIAAVNTGSLTIAPTTQIFASTPVGGTSSTLTSTITNTTNQTIYLSSDSLTDAVDFTQTTNCSGILSANGSTCTVTFTFTPQTSGVLTSTYSDP